MSAQRGFRLHPLAGKDIAAIWKYIADDNVFAAGRFREELLREIRALVEFPQQGYRRPELSSRPLRFKAVREYVIAYAPDKKPLWVVAVFHGRRDPRVIAAMLRGRE